MLDLRNNRVLWSLVWRIGAEGVDLGDVVVGVVRTDLGFELVVEPEGVKRY
jgi:hypothetical protein